MTAGVAYSADPRTGRRDRLLIATADEEVEVELALPQYKVVTRKGPLNLTDDQCVWLARLVVRLEWAVGEGQDPQMADWSFDGQRFTLQNPRPITNLPRVTVPLAVDQPPLWSNGNLSDAVAGVPTIASWSFIAPFLRAIFFAPVERLGYTVPPGMELVRRFEGRAYLDLSTLQAIYFEALGVPPAESNRSLGGPSEEIEVPPPDQARKRIWRRRLLRGLWLLLRHQGTYARAIARVYQSARQTRQLDLTTYSNTQLIELSERIGKDESDFAPLFQVGNFEAGVWLGRLEQLIERSQPGQGRSVASALMAGSGQVTSAEHGYRLLELATVAAREPAVIALLNDPAADPQAWQALPDDSAFKQALARFLDEFGHRGVYEAEMANPRWLEDPRFLLQQVRSYLGQEPPLTTASARRSEAERAVKQLPWPARLLVRWLASRARRSAALREDGKSALIAMALPVRFILLEFGRRMVDAGVIDRVDDVFHLSRMDLETFVRGEWDGSDFCALVDQRRRLREGYLAGPEPPSLITGHPLVVLQTAARTDERVLRGMAAAPGRACGPARLILHPSDSGRLQRGDVLVAPSTDPGWTPLFLRTAAVVTEVGGFLSHGAIVAREYGIPAVVNVSGVLQVLEDGETVCVDGNNGLVERSALP